MLIDRACPFCLSKDSEVYLKDNLPIDFSSESFSCRGESGRYNWVQNLCKNCKVVYSALIPLEEEFIKKYKVNYDDNSELSKIASLTNLKILKNHLNFLAGCETVLEFGSGSGYFLEQLKNIGFENCFGIDPSSGDVDEIADSSCDLVCSFHTLEHLYNPKVDLKKLIGYLKPNGILFCVFHNSNFIFHRLLKRYSPLYDLQHLQLFNAEQLKKLMGQLGARTLVDGSVKNQYPLKYWLGLTPFKKTEIFIPDYVLNKMSLVVSGGNSYAFFKKERQ